jgi:hypothetical protein
MGQACLSLSGFWDGLKAINQRLREKTMLISENPNLKSVKNKKQMLTSQDLNLEVCDSTALVENMSMIEGIGIGTKNGSRKPMNSTAYRIFKLLQWLVHSPLSVDALNRLFVEDPFIGKPLSNDSIWLYINTLKMLGCKIRRPSPRNNFQYELLSHPFGLMLSDRQLQTLAQVKAFAQQCLLHQEMWTLSK